jgi:ABC-2 type transport system ATP-binding protein
LVKTFSGGMKRRLEIARGLLHNPEILFLDEPTQGLDPQTRNHIWEYIQDLNRENKITVFFTTHYMEEAEQIAKRIAIMDHGKIIEIGSADDFKTKTNTDSLEKAFLKLTGTKIRDEEVSGLDRLRNRGRMWGR